MMTARRLKSPKQEMGPEIGNNLIISGPDWPSSTTPIGCRRVAVSHSILLCDLLRDLEHLGVPVGVLFYLHVLSGLEYPVNLRIISASSAGTMTCRDGFSW